MKHAQIMTSKSNMIPELFLSDLCLLTHKTHVEEWVSTVAKTEHGTLSRAEALSQSVSLNNYGK